MGITSVIQRAIKGSQTADETISATDPAPTTATPSKGDKWEFYGGVVEVTCVERTIFDLPNIVYTVTSKAELQVCGPMQETRSPENFAFLVENMTKVA